MVHSCDVKMAVCGRGASFFHFGDGTSTYDVLRDGTGTGTGAGNNTIIAEIAA